MALSLRSEEADNFPAEPGNTVGPVTVGSLYDRHMAGSGFPWRPDVVVGIRIQQCNTPYWAVESVHLSDSLQ